MIEKSGEERKKNNMQKHARGAVWQAREGKKISPPLETSLSKCHENKDLKSHKNWERTNSLKVKKKLAYLTEPNQLAVLFIVYLSQLGRNFCPI